MSWFTIVSAVMVIMGMIYAFFGLAILPVSSETLLPWENAVYGATMIGWGTTLLFVGRLAFSRKEPDFMKAMLYGILVWFAIESSFSAYLGVFFNVGVDVAVLGLLSYPLIHGVRHQRKALT